MLVMSSSPPVEVLLLMDTGSPLMWTQCQPCDGCFKQRSQFYDSRVSTTYRELPCADPICADPHSFQCTDNHCVYGVRYGDDTTTVGIASTEAFSFPDGSSASDVMFGCSKAADLVAEYGLVSGIFGLSGSPDSILTQLFPPEKRRFSYCFSPFGDRTMGAKTLMRFGDDVGPARTPNLRTPFVNNGVGIHYDLQLLDISVGKCRLGFPSGTFAPSGPGRGGFIIDSGAVYPQIQEKAYPAVIGEFEKQYGALGLQRIKSPTKTELELCYRKPAGFSDYITMTYHLQGADYLVKAEYTSRVDVKGLYFCVVVQPYKEMSVLGAWHQQNKRLVYDVSVGALSFGDEDCSADAW